MAAIPFVVLDSMYFRNLMPPELAALRARGFRISLSEGSFQEVWANSERNDEAGRVFGPLLRIALFVDPNQPVIPSRGRLTHWITGRSRALRRAGQEDSCDRVGWLLGVIAAGAAFNGDFWREVGTVANDGIDRQAAAHVARHKRWFER